MKDVYKLWEIKFDLENFTSFLILGGSQSTKILSFGGTNEVF